MTRAAMAALLTSLMFIAPACRGDDASRVSAQRDEASFIAVDPNSPSPTDRAIGKAQLQLKNNIKDDTARLALADAYLQKAREVADPSLYVKCDALLKDVVKRLPKNPDVWTARGTLALAQHKFRDALSFGKTAMDLAPTNEGAYGVLVDANNELGNVDDALRATQEMADARPNLPALSRVSYARELRGDLPGAITAMNQAIIAGGSGGGENVAYVQTLLGGLLLTSGDANSAERAYNEALTSFPDFAAAKVGLARVYVARNDFNKAADTLGAVVNKQPLAEYAAAQGDALEAAGKPEEAQKAYDLVDVITKLYQSNGVNVDRETALFDADHHPGKGALSQARKALKDRPSAAGHDVIAWNLYKLGSLGEAARESDKALALGSKDPQEQFHAAAIAEARKDTGAARLHLQSVLDTNPRFSAVFIQQVNNMAARLGLTVPAPK